MPWTEGNGGIDSFEAVNLQKSTSNAALRMTDVNPTAQPELRLLARNSTLFHASGLTLLLLAAWSLAQGTIALCFASRFFSWNRGADLTTYVLIGLLTTVALWVVALVGSLRSTPTMRKYTLDYSAQTKVPLIWAVCLIIWEAATYASLFKNNGDAYVVAGMAGIGAVSWIMVLFYMSDAVPAMIEPTVTASSHDYYAMKMNDFNHRHPQ